MNFRVKLQVPFNFRHFPLVDRNVINVHCTKFDVHCSLKNFAGIQFIIILKRKEVDTMRTNNYRVLTDAQLNEIVGGHILTRFKQFMIQRWENIVRNWIDGFNSSPFH